MMPILSKEQIVEIELEMAELIEENEQLRKENIALKEALNRMRKERDG
jgi:regulator of replication initiation timing